MDTKRLTDKRLMELVDEGGKDGKESLGTLFIRHTTALKIFLLTRGFIGDDYVEDIVQQTWTHLLEVPKNSFDSEKGAFRPWICSIGANLARNFHRYARRIRQGGRILHFHLHAIPKQEGEPIWDNRIRQEPYPSPVKVAIVNEQCQYVRNAIQKLPEKHRQVMEAVWLDEKTFRGFADETGITRGTLEYLILMSKEMMSKSLSLV